MTFAKRLRAAREKAGLTQSEAAKKAGYSLSAIVKFEGGKRTPRALVVPAILTAIQPPP